MPEQPLPNGSNLPHRAFHLDHAPAVEVSIGVGFEPLAEWDIVGPGAFFGILPEAFNETRSTPRLDPILESEELDDDDDDGEVPRVWYRAQDLNLLVQVQNNRFSVNWGRMTPDAVYPGFPEILRQFNSLFDLFLGFMGDRGATIQLTAAEIGYMNHFDEGTLWKQRTDVGRVFSGWFSLPEQFADTVSIGASIRRRLVDKAIRIDAEVSSGVRRQDRVHIVALNIEGKTSIRDFESLNTELLSIREEVGATFLILTSTEAHNYWGLRWL